MDIKKFYDCDVKIYTTDGRRIIGHIIEYFYADQNENGQQSIIVESMAFDDPIEFFDEEIANIETYTMG